MRRLTNHTDAYNGSPMTLRPTFQQVALVGGAILALGCALFIFWLAPQRVREWEWVQKAWPLDAEALSRVAPGEKVLITGTLTGNPARVPEGLVAYARQQASTPHVGTWATTAQVWPALAFSIDGKTFHTRQVDALSLGGALHVVEVGITQTVRLVGFRNGDLVTLVGYKDATGQLVPLRLHGGSRQELLSHLRRGTWPTYLASIACTVVALFLVLCAAGKKRLASRWSTLSFCRWWPVKASSKANQDNG